jgi:23S rRNA pseudouridine1911/1915/1917 synthase
VQGDNTGDIPLSELLKVYLKIKYQKPGNVFAGVTHRLDRPVSGVVLFAKTSKALTRLNKLFHDKEIKKTYWALTNTPPAQPSGTLIHNLFRNTEKNKSFVSPKGKPDTKEAILDYKILSTNDKYYLLEILLHTGRHHQIRTQLAHIGCPIKGDLKYGYSEPNSDKGISLHARSIDFIHPVKQTPIKIIAPTPQEPVWQKFEKLMT